MSVVLFHLLVTKLFLGLATKFPCERGNKTHWIALMDRLGQKEITKMKILAGLLMLGVVLGAGASANAKGCIKGAIVGGVAGHMAGHGTAGAVAGCVIGHHEANKRQNTNQNR